MTRRTIPDKAKPKHVNKQGRNLSMRTLRPMHIMVILAFIVLGLFAVPKEYIKYEQVKIGYATETKDENAIELGTFQTASEGLEGIREAEVKYHQSLFNYVFRKNSYTKTEVGSKVVSEPKNKIVLKGTRKWQYMMCSDGTHRYFTDEQFKNPTTGFTSASPDACTKNNQGNKIGLADSPNGNSTSSQLSYTPFNCTSTLISPGIRYENASWLYIGETQEIAGINGYQYTCNDGRSYPPIKPLDKIVYTGTRVKSTATNYENTYSSGTPTQDYQAKYKCDSEYASAKATLGNAGAGSSSAMDQVEQYYANCLRKAGF